MPLSDSPARVYVYSLVYIPVYVYGIEVGDVNRYMFIYNIPVSSVRDFTVLVSIDTAPLIDCKVPYRPSY